jgi:hypothetical protein
VAQKRQAIGQPTWLLTHTVSRPSADTHGLDAEAVVGAEQQLGGAVAGDAAVQLAGAADPVGGAGGRGCLQLVPEGLGQHAHLAQAAGALGVKPVVQLPAAEGSLAMGHGPLLQRGNTHAQQGHGLSGRGAGSGGGGRGGHQGQTSRP